MPQLCFRLLGAVLGAGGAEESGRIGSRGRTSGAVSTGDAAAVSAASAMTSIMRRFPLALSLICGVAADAGTGVASVSDRPTINSWGAVLKKHHGTTK